LSDLVDEFFSATLHRMTVVHHGFDTERGVMVASIFPGDGEMASRCRAFDWSTTALGPVSSWPHSLRTTVGIVLSSRNPMFLWWGPELIQFYNDAYRPSFGLTGRHPVALGMNGRDCWPEVWDVIGPQIAQVMTTGEPTWHEDQLVPIERNGRVEDVWWTYSYSPVFDDDGAIGGTLVVCQETTQRVLAQAQLRAVYDGTREFIGLLSLDGTLLDANRASLEFIEQSRADVVGRPFWDTPWFAYTPGAREAVRECVMRAAAGELVSYEATIRRHSGETFTFDISLHPIRNETGDLVFVVPEGRDVSERRRLLVEAEHARADAEAANRVKSEFLAVMSHELRTPLNAIGGYADLIEMGVRGPVTQAQREDLHRIQMSQRHLVGLINEVLNYAKIETGTVQFDVAEVRVYDALIAAEQLVAPQSHAEGLRLAVTDCPPGLVVRADSAKLRQIIVNLLSNAVKFTDRGGFIELSCVVDADRVLVHVRDTGVGIPADKLDAIFAPFVQVRSNLARRHDGTGLGLAISRDLARGMGGDITVKSVLGAGSTFTLWLPAAPPDIA
jgi:PAS domain S-box-containing protein